MRISAFLLLGALAAGVASMPANAQVNGPSTEPILQIETQMHISAINRASLSADGRTLATASNDKTVRIWQLPEGRLRKVLRTPVGRDTIGSVYAVALSPDGQKAAVSSWTGTSNIYIYDVASGAIQRVMDQTITFNDLQFSPDGKRLAASAWGIATGMRLWDVESGQVIAEDNSYSSLGGNRIGYSPTGEFAVSSYDGILRVYDPDGQLIIRAEAPSPNRNLSGIAFSPDGSELAVSYDFRARIDILSLADGAWVASPDTSGIPYGDVHSIAWSSDGGILYGGGTTTGTNTDTNTISPTGNTPVYAWPERGRGKRTQMPFGGNNSVFGIKPYGDKGILFVTADPMISIIQGRRRGLALRSHKPDFRSNQGDALMASADGMRVRALISKDGRKSVMVDLAKLTVEINVQTAGDLLYPNWELGTLFPQGTAVPLLRGRPLPWVVNDIGRVVAKDPARQSFFYGTGWYLRKYTTDGRPLWTHYKPDGVYKITTVQGGNIVIAALGDGTIRWYRSFDGQELLAFYLDTRENRWVIWTPSGYYAASAGGEDLIGWAVNRSNTEAPDFFKASRFRETLYRPDVIQQVLKTSDDSLAVKQANAAAGRTDEAEKPLLTSLPPVVELAMESDEIITAEQTVRVRYRVRSPSGAPITAVEFLVDGRPVKSRAAVEIPEENEAREADVPVPDRDSEIGIFARTQAGAGEVTRIKVKWDGTVANMFKPKLYALAIGVSDYENPDLRLNYAAKDAQEFANALNRQEGGLYGDVEVKVLTDKRATRDQILGALDWLEGAVTSRDVGMVFVAGHGVTDPKQRFFYLPVDADTERLRSTALSGDDLQDSLSRIAGKTIMFMDACYSAKGIAGQRQRNVPVDVNLVVNELTSAENGVVMFASSTGRQVSLEDDRWQNGAFTEALLEGLAGKADFIRDGKLTINELDLWLARRVKELSDSRQAPMARKPEGIDDYPIALIR